MMLILLASAFAGPPVFAADTYMRLKLGEKAPDFRLKDVTTGKIVTLHEFHGKKIVMLEFWATWCDICKREMPSLTRLSSAWKDRGFELLSIVLPSGNIDDVRKLIREKKINYAVLLDADLSVATKSFGLAGPIPLKVVVDHRGIIRYTHVGDYAPGDDELPTVLDGLVREMRKAK
jgi:peroxiredoxin